MDGGRQVNGAFLLRGLTSALTGVAAIQDNGLNALRRGFPIESGCQFIDLFARLLVRLRAKMILRRFPAVAYEPPNKINPMRKAVRV
jgi:hypothetical protein